MASTSKCPIQDWRINFSRDILLHDSARMDIKPLIPHNALSSGIHLKNSYCDTDPFIIIAACCYVAGKAEESPNPIENVAAEARYFVQWCVLSVSFFTLTCDTAFCSSDCRISIQNQIVPVR